MSDDDFQAVLFPTEAEMIIESLEEIVSMEEVGKVTWHKLHEYLEKLNMQAILSATHGTDEFIKEYLVTHEKLNLIVKDLIITELWKEKVFPKIKKLKYQPSISFPIYAILYHEATAINLLETVLYHQDSMENISDGAIDMADYCYRKLLHLVFSMKSPDCRLQTMQLKTKLNTTENEDVMTELSNQNRYIEFEVAVKALSILRYMIDHLSILPLSVATRILNTYDVPALLVSLIDDPPWVVKDSDDTIWKFIENTWQILDNCDNLVEMSRLEGQVWIALYQLLMTPECQQKYEVNYHRKNTLMKLRPHLTDVKLDQMPCLGELRRYLEYLSMSEAPAVKSDLILEQLPEVRDHFLNSNKGKWSSIAEGYIQWLESEDAQHILQRQAKVWSEAYSNETMESLITSVPKCANCGHDAAKRCSRCRTEWYCRRECQLEHWKKHKKACDLMAAADN